MWQRSNLSRLYPLSGSFFTTVFGNASDSDQKGNVIAQVSSGSRGVLENIDIESLSERLFRFRVVGYSRNGFTDEPQTIGKPTVKLSAVPLSDFPLVDGQVDETQFVTNGGSIADINLGTPELSLGGIVVGSGIQLGKPTGGLSDVRDLGVVEDSTPRIVRVREIINPYIITLGVSNGQGGFSNCVDPQVFGGVFNPQFGDTLAQSLGGDSDDTSSSRKIYNVGVDVKLRQTTGEILNNALSFPYSLLTDQTITSVGSD